MTITGAWHLLTDGRLSQWSTKDRKRAEEMQQLHGGTIVRRMPTPRGVHIDGEHDPSVIAVLIREVEP